MEKVNEDKISQMIGSQDVELERRRQDYSDKMEADSMRYHELNN